MMKRYENYRPSGFDWIGEIPKHWFLATIGRVCNLGRGRVISAIEIGENAGEYPVYSSQTENNGVMGYLNTYDFEGEYVTWTTDGANAGTVFYREGKFNCTNVCGTIQPKNWEQIELRFLPYFLNLGTKYSVRLDINPKLMNNMMAKIPFVIPPKEEQFAIANYLDEKTAQIDSLISNKQNLIGLLKEERTAIINKAVTKGVNPRAKLKPSGIEWLGDIPEHWEVKKLKYVVKILSGFSPEQCKPAEQENALPYIKVDNLNIDHAGVDKTKEYTSEEFLVSNKPSILFPKRGAAIALNKVAILDYPFCMDTNLMGLEVRDNKIDMGYLFYIIKNISLISIADTSTIPQINNKHIGPLEIPYPSEEEQYSIVHHIETHTTLIDATISKIEKEIDLLQEYRSALISEVVTGKIKVT